MLTIEQKLANLVKARRRLENAIEEVFEAGKLVDEILTLKTNCYSVLRMVMVDTQDSLKGKEKELRQVKEVENA